jgi:hypothetical protein
MEWAHLPGTLRDGWKGFWRWSISLYGSPMKGNWRQGSVAGDPGGYVEKALERGISFRKGHAGESGRGTCTRDFWEMDEGGSRNGVFPYEEVSL